MGLRKIFSLLALNERGMSLAINKKRKLLALNLSSQFKYTIKFLVLSRFRVSVTISFYDS